MPLPRFQPQSYSTNYLNMHFLFFTCDFFLERLIPCSYLGRSCYEFPLHVANIKACVSIAGCGADRVSKPRSLARSPLSRNLLWSGDRPLFMSLLSLLIVKVIAVPSVSEPRIVFRCCCD